MILLHDIRCHHTWANSLHVHDALMYSFIMVLNWPLVVSEYSQGHWFHSKSYHIYVLQALLFAFFLRAHSWLTRIYILGLPDQHSEIVMHWSHTDIEHNLQIMCCLSKFCQAYYELQQMSLICGIWKVIKPCSTGKDLCKSVSVKKREKERWRWQCNHGDIDYSLLTLHSWFVIERVKLGYIIVSHKII